ncbi:DUF2332 family protein [Sphingomonas sp. BGYR3]|uniref:DUF2332 domain-containing protein n=1 Tax=Sphingomonas sp. BGYR3 TaxID=2975483 RepID=UPI0021A48CAA|nr:DUF2332 family protein [Sphingomonas sp. BGYR3]MDG5488288.1 DUF2332 family protein [Sphingomonas sp. BGYR3]
MTSGDGGEFQRQAAICRTMQSPFTASVLEAGARMLSRGPRTAQMIADWPGSRSEAAVALRFSAAMHALARRRANPALVALYHALDGDFDAVIGATLAAHDDWVAQWMQSPPQTNEVYRAGPIMAALLCAVARFSVPFELLELGSSAGLNLNLHRFAYDLGGVRAGNALSLLRIAPSWRGPPPPAAPVQVTQTRGVDRDPLDPLNEGTKERLRAYCWPDQTERMARLEAALAMAAVHPPRIDRGDAADWLEAQLALPQAEGTGRAVFHSIVLQYLDAAGRDRVARAMAAAGRAATAARPLAWISFEWDEGRSCVEIALTLWPDGTRRVLGTSHAHGAWVDWTG